jgi:sugar transferase (PEP-CTERM/EpsH1 system associated)
MAKLLYLVHRMPYPPDKGDKVRSYHLLRHLVARHEVYVGTFIDDASDEPHISTLRSICAGLHVAPLNPRAAKLRSLSGLLTGDALTLHYYRDPGLANWVRRTIGEQRIDTTVVFSSSMAQYVDGFTNMRTLVDFVDVDSAKWAQYAGTHGWPLSWLYHREATRLLACERRIAASAQRSFFVTETEASMFRTLAPECAHRIEPMCNGVDAEFFAPDPCLASPFTAGELPIVFTGAMDYWPNIDAVTWFAQDVLPVLRRLHPNLRFHVVGRNPSSDVRALAGEAVAVTGTVPDVRPYLQHAAVVVAPLRVARGIQNKVLEAMAMARPVVASSVCVQPIDARPGLDLLCAADADQFVQLITDLLASRLDADAIGRAGRLRVLERYTWSAHLAGIDRHLNNLETEGAVA